MEKTNPVIFLRASLGSVFVWFGIDKLLNTAYWYMWMPQYAMPFFSPDSLRAFIFAMGITEAVLGICIITGFYLRRASLASAAILAAIIVSFGILPAIRDIGFLGISIYLYLLPESRLEKIKIGGRGKALLAAVVLAVFVASLVFGASEVPVRPETEKIEFIHPEEGSSVKEGEMTTTINVGFNPKKTGANHVHVKLDGSVVDAIYVTEKSEISSTFSVPTGEHVLDAYLALSDHRELKGSRVSVTFTAG